MLTFDELSTDLQDVLADWPARRATPTKETTMTMNANTPNSIDWRHLHEELSRPFSDSIIKYRVGAVSRDKKKAQALPYVDPRAYEDRLNALVPGSWSVSFEPWGADRIICRLTIHGVTRGSTGDGAGSPDQIAGTAAEAQALKRACSKFGLGRHLYDIPISWIDYDPSKNAFAGTVKATTSKGQHDDGEEQGPRRGHEPAQAQMIGRNRAAAMALEMARLGIARSKQAALAAQVLGRNVGTFNTLTELEARKIWHSAQHVALKASTTSFRRSHHRHDDDEGHQVTS